LWLCHWCFLWLRCSSTLYTFKIFFFCWHFSGNELIAGICKNIIYFLL
jgi:hypothetical protein